MSMRRDSRVRWLIVWLLCSAVVAVAINLCTGSSLLDLTPAHIVIALLLGAFPMALLVGIAESYVFITGIFAKDRP
jgi:hypothetical protein